MSPLRVQGMTLELHFSYKQTFNSQTQAHVYKALTSIPMWQPYLYSEKSWNVLQPNGSRRYNIILIILSLAPKHSNGDCKKYEKREDLKYKTKILVCKSLTGES